MNIENKIPEITALKMLLASCITFVIVYHFQLPESVWALVSIAAVAQAGVQLTFIKLLMRAIGTILGAVIGYSIAIFSIGDPVSLIIVTFFILWAVSYLTIQSTIYSYAGIIMGMTIAIIVFFDLENGNLLLIAFSRTYEVFIGITILSIVAYSLYYFLEKKSTQPLTHTPVSLKMPSLTLNLQYLIPSFKIACACILTFLIWHIFQQPEGYWAPISCLLIMEENTKSSLKKGFLRFFSHVAAVIIGFLCMIPLLHAAYFWRLIPLLICFTACGYLLGKKNQYSSMGNTIGIAVSIMLLSSASGDATLHIIFDRLYNVIIGIAVAYVMLIPWPILGERQRE